MSSQLAWKASMGSTPLLFSISAQRALDSVTYVKEQKTEVRNLCVPTSLTTTRPKHLATSLTKFGKNDNARYDVTSGKNDLHVYMTTPDAEADVVSDYGAGDTDNDDDGAQCAYMMKQEQLRQTGVRSEDKQKSRSDR